MSPLAALTSVHGSFAAHVLAARLQSEGIDVELRGAIGGPYGLTMGELARVDLYVPEEQMDDARLVMLASEVDAVMALPTPDPDPALGEAAVPVAPWAWIAVLVLVVGAIAVPVLHILGD